ncbi:MAG: putative DNA-binding domain-containing protein [Nitratireductor sp.]
MSSTTTLEEEVSKQLNVNADFCDALLNPTIEIPSSIQDTKNKPSTKRFNVYRNNVVVSLMESMKAAYPSIHAIMGEDNFAKIARIYISQHPPSSPVMQKFGSHFADFIKAFAPLKNSPFLSDVALVERLYLEAYHALDEEPLNPELLSSIPPEKTGDLVFSIHPAAHLISSEYPVLDLFEYRFEHPQSAPDLSKAQSVLITRPHLQNLITDLDTAQAIFVGAIIKGQTLANALGEALAHDQNFQPNEAISLLIQTGMTHHAELK